MGHELVPTTYDRQVHGILYGAETSHHNDQLTAEQAMEINDNFDVNIVPVRHGYGLEMDPEALRNGNAPGVDDYEHVKSVVDAMSPKDVLLTEGVGFDSEHDAPQYFLDADVINVLERVYKSGNADEIDHKKLSMAKEQLSSERDNYLIDSIDYAVKYALLNGVTVVFADMDSYESSRLDAMVGDDGRDSLGMPLDARHLEVANSLREKRATDTVKDVALEKLQHSQMPRSVNGGKSRLVLLYGADHADGLKHRFDNLGINVNIIPEAVDDPVKRQIEITEHLEHTRAA